MPAISSDFFKGFLFEMLHTQELPSPFINLEVQVLGNEFSKVGPAKKPTPPTMNKVHASTSTELIVVHTKGTSTSPVGPLMTPSASHSSTFIPARSLSLEPPAKKAKVSAKKVKRYEYAEELKTKTREELLTYFEAFTGHGVGGFFCGFGQCDPTSTMKRKAAKVQHVKDHVEEVLETYKCEKCLATFTRATKLADHVKLNTCKAKTVVF